MFQDMGIGGVATEATKVVPQVATVSRGSGVGLPNSQP